MNTLELNLPSAISDDAILAFAIASGYQSQVITTPAVAEQPATLTYDANNNPVTVAEVPASDAVMGNDPQSTSDFVVSLFKAQILSAYQASVIAAATVKAEADKQAEIAAAVQAVEQAINA
jgi:hypothetical protein